MGLTVPVTLSASICKMGSLVWAAQSWHETMDASASSERFVFIECSGFCGQSRRELIPRTKRIHVKSSIAILKKIKVRRFRRAGQVLTGHADESAGEVRKTEDGRLVRQNAPRRIVRAVVLMFWITFAATRERVTPPPAEHKCWEELSSRNTAR